MNINKEKIMQLVGVLTLEQVKTMLHAFYVPTDTVAQLFGLTREQVIAYGYNEPAVATGIGIAPDPRGSDPAQIDAHTRGAEVMTGVDLNGDGKIG